LWDGRKSAALSFTLWLVDADAAQLRVHVERNVLHEMCLGATGRSIVLKTKTYDDAAESDCQTQLRTDKGVLAGNRAAS
jgi:hypothetical protein